MPTNRLFLSLLTLSAILLITSDIFAWHSPAVALAHRVFQPALGVLHAMGFRLYENVDFLLDLPRVHQENQELQRQFSQMAYLQVENQRLRGENQALRNQLTIQGVTSQQLLPAQVLGQVNVGTDVFLLIAAGISKGVQKGRVVIWEKNLVGQVESVVQSFARVRPIYSSQSEVSVLVGEREASGKAKGELNTKVRLTEVLQEEELKEGDLIVSSGAEGAFPPGLIVGKVSKIFSKDWQLFKEAAVEAFWESSDLRTVFVMME